MMFGDEIDGRSLRTEPRRPHGSAYKTWAVVETTSEMTNYGADRLQGDTTLLCDSFFGSHKTADSLASRRVPFLFLVPENTKGVPAAGQQLAEGAYRVGHTKAVYSLYAFKSPPVGSKAGKLVPMLTNCEVVGQYTTHKRWGGPPRDGVPREPR